MLPTSKLYLSLLVTVALFLPTLSEAQPAFTQLLDNGPTDKRLNIVILGDGYTSSEQTDFNADAVNMMNFMLGASPLSSYSTYFNVFSIFTASIESGSDHPSLFIYVNTYFSGTFDSYGIERLTTIPPNDQDGDYSHGMGKVFSLLATYVPNYDIIVLIFNDPQYGGSGGTIAITSVHGAAPEIVVHEFGHTFSNLADEYEDFTPGYSGHEAPNATAQTVRELIKWNQWILPSTPVPTPETGTYGSVVGLFEGCVYETNDWYRPKLNCKMRSLGPAFCEVCKEQTVISIYNLLSPLESFSPLGTVLDFTLTDSIELSVTPLQPANHSLEIEWLINGAPVPGETSTTFMLYGSDLNSGVPNSVTGQVTDPTGIVRNDPGQKLIGKVTWTVNMAGVDSDFDGVFDHLDNCVADYNPSQADADSNGIGDACCCVGDRGDANDDGEDVNILDLTFMVDFIFRGGERANCPKEADFNSDGNTSNILDLTFAVDRLFRGGLAPGPCL